MGRLRPILRLALRDAAQNRGRTALMLAVIALPILASLLALSAGTPAVTSREQALASLPDGAQAQITATTVGGPIRQLPEAIPPMPRESAAMPADREDIVSLLPADVVLHEWWNSPPLIMTRALDLAPGEEHSAEASTVVGDLDATALDLVDLREGDPATLDLILPELLEGTAPSGPEEIVVARAAAQAAGLRVGDEVQLIAPPSTGWMSTDGRTAQVMQNSTRGYRISGIVEGEQALGWALPTWVAPALSADQAWVDRHFVATGPTAVSWQQVRELNSLGVGAISRGAIEDYPAPQQLYPTRVNPQRALLVATLLCLTAVGVGALLIVLVTPALTVGAERMRRTLGLVVAVGARPRDAAVLFLLQGAVLGLAGSAVGALLALVGIPLLRPMLYAWGAAPMGPVPWWAAPVLVMLGTALATMSAIPPAWKVTCSDPVDLLADRGARRPSAPHRAARTMVTAAVLLVIGATAALASSALPAALSIVALIGGLLAVAAGTLLALPGLISGVAHVFRLVPRAVMLRAAARDSARHLGRTVPAVLTVIGCTAGVAALSGIAGSHQANEQLMPPSMVVQGRAVIGMQTPVSDQVDQAIIGSVLDELDADGLVTGHHPVYGAAEPGTWIEAAPAPGKLCPDEEGPSIRSATDPEAPLECVPYDDSYQPGLTFPSWLGNQVSILEPETMRATGLPGAEKAAQVLADGGAIVNDATRVDDDGMVELGCTDGDTAETKPLGQRPGMYLPGFEPHVTISPDTARDLEFETRYLGEIVLTPDPLDGAGREKLREAAIAVTPVVWPDARPAPNRMGVVTYERGPSQWETVAAALTALAVVAVVLSVQLGRREAEADLATMQAVGASRGQVRRYGMTQALVILCAGVPMGLALGAVVCLAVVGALRRSGEFGPFLSVTFLPALLAVSLTALAALTLGSALMLARPPRDLATRRRE